MASRTGIVVGIATIAAGIAWFALHDGGSDATAPSTSAPEGSQPASASAAPGAGSAATTTSRDGKITLGATERPTALTPPPSPAGGTPFEAQQRDPEWAPRTEADIKHRFATGVRGGKLVSAECRHDQCLLTMSGTEDEMSKAMADLETPGGLLGFADHIVLNGPETREGELIIKAYAVFDRRVTDEN